jgi:SAM-dependent methyltransferase
VIELRRAARKRIQGALEFLGLAPGHTLLASREAYRLWSATYDAQPDNVILHLEAGLFGELLSDVAVEGKTVLDVGCGTGRHWERLMARHPASLIGADSSPHMLERLRCKYPEARVHAVDGGHLVGVADGSIDILVSTLAIGHIRNVAQALAEWARALRNGGHMILTDFHPEAFRAGMKRTFVHAGHTIEVENHLHSVESLRGTFRELGLEVVAARERGIDDAVRGLFERQGYLAAFERFQQTPVILGFHLANSNGKEPRP